MKPFAEAISTTLETCEKQTLIEHVLDMWVSKKQLDDIRLQWHAFFADPLKYKDTMVPEMVKQYLSELEKETRLN